MYKYFQGKIRKFVVDPPKFLESIVEANMPYMGTVNPADDFNEEAAAARAADLKKAIEGVGTDEAKIIDIMAHHSNEQRQVIKKAYAEAYKEDLESSLKGDLSGNFQKTVLALLAPPSVYDAKELREAVRGCGTNEWTIIEILSSRTNKQIREIKEAYKNEFGRDLEKDLRGDTKGGFSRLLMFLCGEGRDESSKKDKKQAEEDAKAIANAGVGQWEAPDAKVDEILGQRNYNQLEATFEAYSQLTGSDIEVTIRKECSGSLQDAYLAIVKCARNTGRFFAMRLLDATKGVGTDDNTLIRIVVSRSELDLAAIAELYQMDYKRKLFEDIGGDTSGDYKALLMAILGDMAK